MLLYLLGDCTFTAEFDIFFWYFHSKYRVVSIKMGPKTNEERYLKRGRLKEDGEKLRQEINKRNRERLNLNSRLVESRIGSVNKRKGYIISNWESIY